MPVLRQRIAAAELVGKDQPPPQILQRALADKGVEHVLAMRALVEHQAIQVLHILARHQPVLIEALLGMDRVDTERLGTENWSDDDSDEESDDLGAVTGLNVGKNRKKDTQKSNTSGRNSGSCRRGERFFIIKCDTHAMGNNITKVLKNFTLISLITEIFPILYPLQKT